jgi:hypothetical protein
MCSHLKNPRGFLSRPYIFHPRSEDEEYTPLSPRKSKPPKKNHHPKKTLKGKDSSY